MGDFGDLAPDPRDRDKPKPKTFEGTVINSPAVDKGVRVKVKHFDGEVHVFGPCPWTARIIDGDTYGTPSEGDRALITVNEEDEPWVVEWWPEDYE